MDLSIKKFKNIYGIKDLKGISDINTNALIYAPNGGTKSSFALGIDAIANGVLPKDRIYNNNGEYEFEFDGKRYTHQHLEKIDNIVVYNFEKYSRSTIDMQSSSLGLLTVSSELMKKYGEIYDNTLQRINNISLEVSNRLGNKKKNDENQELVFNFFTNNNKVNNWKEIIKYLADLNWEDKMIVNYSFFDIFNENTLPIIGSKNFTNEVKIMNNAINSKITTNLFEGTFGSVEASKLVKELSSNGFFEAGHALKIKNIDEIIDSAEKFKNLYETEKQKLYQDENTQKIVENLLSKINKNKNTRAIRNYISEPEILAQMDDLQCFIEKVIVGILEPLKDEIISVKNQITQSDESIKKLIEESENQKTQWENICDVFNNRFDVPFKIKIKNKFNSMIGSRNPVFYFVYNNEVEVNEDLLKETLSTGEKRALTVLYFLFDLFASLEKNADTFVILDDIVDSFDYKNKYAMIEYISELSKESNIMCWILTHNFDFFSTCKHRVNNYNKYFIKKNNNTENFDKFKENIIGGGMELFSDWKEQLKTTSSESKFLGLIPVSRNLIELKYDTQNIKYLTLCSVLHYRSNTDQVKVKDISPIFKEVFEIDISLDKELTISNILSSNVNKLLMKNLSNSVDLDEKIILSIGIRQLLERIFNSIDSTLKDQDLMIGEEYNIIKSDISEEDKKIITKAIISIPEFIHLNSFMYEPLVDITTSSLQKLYKEIDLLKEKYI